MPIYINGVEIKGNVSGIPCFSNGAVSIEGNSIFTSSSASGSTTIITGRGNKNGEWFKGNGEVNFINCTINGHNVSGAYNAKNINKKIKKDFKEQGEASKFSNIQNVENDLILPACISSNDVYTSGSKNQRVKEIKEAANVTTNGSGNIISKGDIIAQNVTTNGSGSIASEHIEVNNGEISIKGNGTIDTESLKVNSSSISNFGFIKSETSEVTNSIIKLIGTFETVQNIKFDSCDFDITAQDNSISVIGGGNFYSDGNMTITM